MLVIVIQNEFTNETLSLVNETKLSEVWLRFSS